MTADKLLPCPFCPDGGNPIREEGQVRCDRCGVMMRDWDNGETAIERWNTRAGPGTAVDVSQLHRDLMELLYDDLSFTNKLIVVTKILQFLIERNLLRTESKT